MGYKAEKNEIEEKVKDLNEKFFFNGLLHFTDFLNLKTILDQGYLYSRSDCENNDINFIDGANHSVLDKASEYVHNCVRFYYRGQTPTLYDNEGIKLIEYCDEVHIPIPVYLLFDEEILYLDNTEFTNGNATNSERGNSASFFKNMDWDAIFHNTWFESEERNNIVNKRHAELLSRDPVPLKYLKKIIFRCETDRKRAINLFGNDDRYTININIFSNKNSGSVKDEDKENNFINNYSIKFEYDENKHMTALLLEMKFQKIWQNYQTAFKILDDNGNMINNYKVEILYKTASGEIVSQSIRHNEIKILRLEGNISNWHKVEIYVNNIACIEEFLIKHEILSYKIAFKNDENKKKMILNRKFVDEKFLHYDHRYEIFNSERKLICEGPIKFKEGSSGVDWNLTFNNYDESWSKIKYYMNDVLCISEEIKVCLF